MNTSADSLWTLLSTSALMLHDVLIKLNRNRLREWTCDTKPTQLRCPFGVQHRIVHDEH